jgi:hypothetical protein
MYNVLSYDLGTLKMLVSAEVDCVDARTGAAIDLKSMKAYPSNNAYFDVVKRETFRNMYTQMLLSNIDTVCIGTIQYPQDNNNNNNNKLVHGDVAQVIDVRRVSRSDLKKSFQDNSLNNNDDPSVWIAKVDELLRWTKTQMINSTTTTIEAVDDRRMATLEYTCCVLAADAVAYKPANKYYNKPERLAKPAVAYAAPSLKLIIDVWMQEKSSLSKKFYDETLVHHFV